MSTKKIRFSLGLPFMVFFVFYFTTFNTAPLPTCILVPEAIKVTAITLLLLPLYNALTERLVDTYQKIIKDILIVLSANAFDSVKCCFSIVKRSFSTYNSCIFVTLQLHELF